MADKAFGVKDVNLIGASGTPTIESPNNLNINAVNVAISTDITVAGKVSLGAGTSISSPGSNVLTLGTNSQETIRINSGGVVVGTGFSVSVNDGYFGLGYGSSISNIRETSTITSNTTDELVLGVGNTDVVRVRPRSLWINRTGAQGGNRDLGTPSTLVVQGSAWGSSTKEPWIQLITDKFSGDIGANASLGRIMFSTNGSNVNTNSTTSGAWISCESRQSWTTNPAFYPADLIFWTNPGQSTPDKAVGITSEGNVRIYKAGAGIDFSANSNAAGMTSELLDDYEEGTFTPSFIAGTVSGGYTRQEGRYTKVGRLVTFTLVIDGNGNLQGAAQQLVIGGLPFTSENEVSEGAAMGGYPGNFDTTNNRRFWRINLNATQLQYLDASANAVNGNAVTNVNSQLNVCGFYFTDS